MRPALQLFEDIESSVGMNRAPLHDMLEAIFELTDGNSVGGEIPKK